MLLQNDVFFCQLLDALLKLLILIEFVKVVIFVEFWQLSLLDWGSLKLTHLVLQQAQLPSQVPGRVPQQLHLFRTLRVLLRSLLRRIRHVEDRLRCSLLLLIQQRVKASEHFVLNLESVRVLLLKVLLQAHVKRWLQAGCRQTFTRGVVRRPSWFLMKSQNFIDRHVLKPVRRMSVELRVRLCHHTVLLWLKWIYVCLVCTCRVKLAPR